MLINNNNFYCEKCNYKCNRKNDFEKHLLTIKHKQNYLKKSIEFICNCGKKYKHKQSLTRHKEKCVFILDNSSNYLDNNKLTVHNNNDDLKGLVCKLINENNEIKNTIMKENEQLRAQVSELIPKVGNNNTNINNNQKFNIQVFLNEKCKDAININDFVKSIEISLEQLNFTKNKGLTEGLSNAIVENMNKLSLYERPLHCTDIKRETLYIKDDDKWLKNDSKDKLKKAIKKASGKNYEALNNWIKDNPDYMEDENKKTFFTHVISNIGKNTDNFDDKIIKKICKETYLKDNVE